MTARQLRAILQRYGKAGVLFVGAYLMLHHVRRARRAQFLVSICLVLYLFVWILVRSAPIRRANRTQTAPPVVSTPAPIAPHLHLSLQDDTAPVPFPPSEGKGPFLSQGALFFSAIFCHWLGQFYQDKVYGGEKEATLSNDEDRTHLFRLTPGKARPQQLTFGEGSDRNPTLSPDGRQIAFTRQQSEGSFLCLVSAGGGPVRTLLHLPQNFTYGRLNQSPDGRWFAMQSGAYDDDTLLLFQARSRETIRLHGIKEAAWSPDGRLYLRHTDAGASIFQPDTRSRVPLHTVMYHAAWLDSHTLIGDSDLKDDMVDGSCASLRIIDDHGRQRRQLPLVLIGKENRYATFFDQHRWHRLPHHPTTVLLETWRDMSDNEHYGCYRVDLRTGQARLVADGALIGVSPDGSRVAVAENAWVGPYKHGGARVGPLNIVSLATGRADGVTDPLSHIEAGDWQASTVRSSRSYVAPLLEAVARGNSAAARTLLAHGANPDSAEPNGATALMIAAADGKVEMVRLLLRYGAHVERTDRDGNTALLYAFGAEKMSDEVATSAQIAIAQRLLHAGARVNAGNHSGSTALMLAAGEGRAVAAEWLLKHGATPNACSKWGQTALMLAVSGGYPHTTQVLLDAHAAVNVKNKREEETALQLAKYPAHGYPIAEIVTLLRQAGATEPP